MAFTIINSSDIDVGKPLKKSLFDTIKNNFDDHESRIDTLEQGAGVITVADFEVVGYISHYSATELSNIATHRAPCDYILQELSITILDSVNGFVSEGVHAVSSSAGFLEINLSKSTDGGATFNSILTTKPKIPEGYFGAGTSSNSTGCIPVLFADTQVYQDDILSISVTSKKDVMGSFLISSYGVL